MTTGLKWLIGITVLIIIAAIAVVLLPGKTIAPTETGAERASIPDIIEVSAPTIAAKVSSPLVARGWARGWYFEASFPIELKDQSGNTIAQGYAQAQSDWMTTNPVNFVSVPLTFAPQPAGSQGTLILRKDNPSGLPENDQSLEVPVTF